MTKTGRSRRRCRICRICHICHKIVTTRQGEVKDHGVEDGAFQCLFHIAPFGVPRHKRPRRQQTPFDGFAQVAVAFYQQDVHARRGEQDHRQVK
jgi:hypothetical protein